MKQNLITDVIQGMLPYLNNAQTERLQEVLQHTLFDYEVTKTEKDKELSEQNLVESFLSAKRIEGCSEKTLKYYNATIQSMLDGIGKGIKYIVTDDIRCYLTEYQAKKKSSKVTIDNIRRILSSFFSWLEDEDYILKSPVRRIHKVKTGTNIKETYSDEALELMRDNCTELRDLAMIDMLASTGMRVGEMVLLNREDIDFNERECVVFGKGLVTDQIVLTIGYDIENLTDPDRSRKYKGDVTIDRYGRRVPKHAHGTTNLKRQTSSTMLITDAVMELYDRIVDKNLLIRRINITANRLVDENSAKKEDKYEQLDLFTDYKAKEQEQVKEEAALEREKRMQQTMLTIKKKFGKNAILKGMNLQEGATAKDRNEQIGGHKA